MAFVVLNDSISCSMDSGEDIRETTTKDSGGNRDISESTKQVSMSIQGQVDGTGYDDIIEGAFLQRGLIGIKWDSETVGDTRYTIQGLVTGFTRGGGLEDNEEYSATFVSTGPITTEIIT